MRFGIPDWLSYEFRHKIEGLRNRFERLHVKDTINDNPRIVAIVALVSVLLLGFTVSLVRRETPSGHYRLSKKAWFYDLNTGELFVSSSKQTGPIAAPSGPLPNGEPAGLRAHVYSFLSDPNEAERFVGFLEKPDPNAATKALTSDPRKFEEWSHGRLIKRVGGDTWVSPTSRRGRQIIQELTHPNSQGRTPMYCTPD